MMEEKKLSHLDTQNHPTMVDVSEKKETQRVAQAQAVVTVPPEIEALFSDGEIQGPKGPVFQTAIIAGTMAAKKTSDLIPFCHPLMINSVKMDIQMEKRGEIKIQSTVKVAGKTGVEMEAITACSVAALTIYDMCKAVSHEIEIGAIHLLKKSGGKSGLYLRR